MSTVFVFPGQGSQIPHMIRDVAVNSYTQETLEEAQQLLGQSLDIIDTPVAFESTEYVQLALLIVGVAAMKALTAYGVNPAFVTGHSIGSFPAAVSAGVLTFEEAFTAVRIRGQSMQEVADPQRWGMAALQGLPLTSVQKLVASIYTDEEPLWIAIINTFDQIVISGSRIALEKLADIAYEAGARALRSLAVPTVSHCPLQEVAEQKIADFLLSIPLRQQCVPYISTLTARCVYNDQRVVIDDLINGVMRPVHWYDAMRVLPEFGITHAVQIPPGQVLSDLMKIYTPTITTIAANLGNLEQTARYFRAKNT